MTMNTNRNLLTNAHNCEYPAMLSTDTLPESLAPGIKPVLFSFECPERSIHAKKVADKSISNAIEVFNNNPVLTEITDFATFQMIVLSAIHDLEPDNYFADLMMTPAFTLVAKSPEILEFYGHALEELVIWAAHDAIETDGRNLEDPFPSWNMVCEMLEESHNNDPEGLTCRQCRMAVLNTH